MKKDFLVKLVYYVVIGVYGVIIDLSVSNLFYNLPILPSSFRDQIIGFISFNVFATIAAILGGIAGFINNFLMNEFLVYSMGGDKLVLAKRFLRYLVTISFGTFFIGKLLIFNFCQLVLHLNFSTSNLIAIALSTLINYPINYFWTWGGFSFSKFFKKS